MGIKNTHAQLVKGGIKLLRLHDIMAWPNNTGALPLPGRKGRWIRFGAKGSPDILGITRYGQAVCAEAKMPGDTVSDEQRAFLNEASQHNALVIVFYNVDDLERALLDVGL